MRTPAILKYTAIAALAFTSFACNDNKPAEQYIPLSDMMPKSGTTPPSNFVPPATTDQGQPMTATAKLNPEHGQPGHRCDLAVGAPLPIESAPAAPVTQSVQPITVAATDPKPAATTAASGLNPEHGKPGHRCDIAVGAPLSSKPATTTTQPVVTTTSTTPAKTAPGMNPAHGEPGHRCDIAVGAPLNPAASDSNKN